MRKKVANAGDTRFYLYSPWTITAVLVVTGALMLGPVAKAQTDESCASPNVRPLAKAVQNTTSAAPATTMASSLGPGDVIDIQVFNTPELSGKQEISEDGLVRLPYSGSIYVAGMSPYYAGLKIERCLAASGVLLKEHHVTVVVFEHATSQVAVLGEVNRPGTYTFQRAPTLATALALAGGLTAKEGEVITVTHQNGESKTYTGTSPDKPAGDTPNVMIDPSDVITVSQIGTIYVLGDVNHPGEYNLSNFHTMYAPEAVALAQGLKQTAKASKASIIRTDQKSGYISTIPVDLTNPRSSLTERTMLQPLDIVVVPYSSYREFEFNLLPGLTGAAANAVALALVVQ